MGDFEFGPVEFNYFSDHYGWNEKDRNKISELALGEDYDLDACSKCGCGEHKRVVRRVK